MGKTDILNCKYILSNNDYMRCNKFADEVLNKYYTRRNQSNPKKIRLDHVRSKIAELIVFNILPGIDYPPDFKIYEAKEKSWKPDLSSSNGVKYGVKSCEYCFQDDISWIFQYSDKHGHGGRDLEFFGDTVNPKLYAVFVTASVEWGYGEIQAIVKATDLKEKGLYKEPRQAYLAGIKKAVYLKDIREAGLAQFVPQDLLEYWREKYTKQFAESISFGAKMDLKNF